MMLIVTLTRSLWKETSNYVYQNIRSVSSAAIESRVKETSTHPASLGTLHAHNRNAYSWADRNFGDPSRSGMCLCSQWTKKKAPTCYVSQVWNLLVLGREDLPNSKYLAFYGLAIWQAVNIGCSYKTIDSGRLNLYTFDSRKPVVSVFLRLCRRHKVSSFLVDGSVCWNSITSEKWAPRQFLTLGMDWHSAIKCVKIEPTTVNSLVRTANVNSLSNSKTIKCEVFWIRKVFST